MEYARLNAVKFGLAAGITVLLLWLAFFLLTMLLGGNITMRMNMGMRAEYGEMAAGGGMMFLAVIVSGLFFGALLGLFAGVMAAIYNRLL